MSEQAHSIRARAVDAVAILNNFVGDFVAGSMTLRDYAQRHQNGTFRSDQMVAISNMCLSHLILTFAKFEEFWSHYNNLVPDEQREHCKVIITFAQNHGITTLRNRYVGHIWHKQKQRPLPQSEVRTALRSIVKNDLREFMDWINDPAGNAYPSTVVSIVETTRDAIAVTYSVRPEEFIDR